MKPVRSMPNSGLSVPVEASLTAALRSRAKSLVVVLAMCGMGAVPMAVTAGDYVAQARELLQSGDPRAAMIQLKNALQDDPKNAQARLLLGQIYLRAGNGEAAEKELRHARSAGMPAESWIADMGRAYLLQGRFRMSWMRSRPIRTPNRRRRPMPWVFRPSPIWGCNRSIRPW